jgi:xanthine dehydrogenase molybdopterin-binding subunit B
LGSSRFVVVAASSALTPRAAQVLSVDFCRDKTFSELTKICKAKGKGVLQAMRMRDIDECADFKLVEKTNAQGKARFGGKREGWRD